ncbi:hypothetical protein FRB99_001206 [Tulasnella sp. 403]|nr:hypothetical protein FRB99_001206 [Tulasnella sp. 403]
MPIADLPPEIMSIIFELVYAQSPNVQLHYWEYWPWQPDPVVKIPTLKQHAILNVMLVCNTWYSLVSQNPALWTNVVVESDRFGQSQCSWMLLASNSVARSKSSPLNITILMTSMNIGNARTLLKPHSNRWRMVSLFPMTSLVAGYEVEQELYELFTGSTLSRLVSLNVWGSVRSPTGDPLRYAFLRTLEIDAPALTTLSLPWFTNQIASAETPLPPTVTIMKSSGMLMGHPSRGIPNAAVLRSLCVTMQARMDLFHDFDLPHLSHLRMAFSHVPNNALDCLLSAHHLPNLTSLSLIMPGYSKDTVSLPSLPKVHCLEWIEGPVGTAPSFDAILAACPNLLHLTCIPHRTMYDNDINAKLSINMEEVGRPFELLERVNTETGEPLPSSPASGDACGDVFDVFGISDQFPVTRDPVPH